MNNVVIVTAIVLLLAGIALMLGNFAFEADLPAWTEKAAVLGGIILTVISMMMSRRKSAG